MSADWEANWIDELLQQDSISTVKTIHIQTHKLSSDKGKLRPSDAAFFEFSHRPRLMCSQEHEKSMSFKVVSKKRLKEERVVNVKHGAKSVAWRDELNEKDSYDILKNLRSSTNRTNMKQTPSNKIWKEILNSLSEEDIENEDQIFDKIQC